MLTNPAQWCLPFFISLFGTMMGFTDAWSQTYVGPAVGYDIATIQGEHTEYGNATRSDEFSSMTYGLKANHKLSGRWALTTHLRYTRKEFEPQVIGICAVGIYEHSDYKRWHTMDLYSAGFSAQWDALDWFYVGAGPTLSYRSEVKMERYQYGTRESIVTYSPARTEYGIQFHVGFRWKNIGLEVGYQHGLISANNDISPDDQFDALHSLSFTANYLFDLSRL